LVFLYPFSKKEGLHIKKQLNIFLLNAEEQTTDLSTNKAFLQTYKTSLLLALLEQKKLTKWQYDRCIEMLKADT